MVAISLFLDIFEFSFSVTDVLLLDSEPGLMVAISLSLDFFEFSFSVADALLLESESVVYITA